MLRAAACCCEASSCCWPLRTYGCGASRSCSRWLHAKWWRQMRYGDGAAWARKLQGLCTCSWGVSAAASVDVALRARARKVRELCTCVCSAAAQLMEQSVERMLGTDRRGCSTRKLHTPMCCVSAASAQLQQSREAGVLTCAGVAARGVQLQRERKFSHGVRSSSSAGTLIFEEASERG
jgi:hypothetical protein